MRYKTIVIDPPWNISTMNPALCRNKDISKKLPYKTMKDEEIMDFPINNFAGEDCDLFLWTTPSKIHTAFHILQAWEFRYGNFLVWNKLDGLSHNGVHNVLEFVLYGYKGRNGLDYKHPIDSYFEQKRIKHSQKPDLFYSILTRITQTPRIDIFARKRHFGFDAYGDQVEGEITYPLLECLATNGNKATEVK
jgi:N6-adenosine-specific RNA methylase IME4